MKQTAVEWLVEELEKHHTKIDIKNTVAFNQAKAMEKEQITAFAKLWEEKLLDGRINSVDDLYNETYKQ
jgi:hypothetical protein